MTLKIPAKSKCFSSLLVCVLLTIVSLKSHSYVKFNNAPTEGWGAIFEQAGVDRYYEVQRRDNLYDISTTLFGDSAFWPKIWSINSGITNPHIIEKGNVIYFSGGTQFEPPRFGVDTIKSISYTYGSGFIRPELPPERLNRKAIEIPKGFQNYFSNVGQEQEEQEALKSISTGIVNARLQKRSVLVTSEVISSQPKSVGEVKRIQTGGAVAKTGSVILVKFKSSQTPSIGDLFTAFGYNRKTFSYKKEKMQTGLVEWYGRVRVIGESKRGEYFAEVMSSNDLLPVGAKLSLETIVTVELPDEVSTFVENSSANRKIEIIGASKAGDATVIGENSIVYVKGGTSLGLVENQIYPIFENFGAGILDRKLSYRPKSIGFIKIARASRNFSTGVVFNLSENVSSGSVLGQLN